MSKQMCVHVFFKIIETTSVVYRLAWSPCVR